MAGGRCVMTKKLLLIGAVALAVLGVAAGTILRPGPADAQEPFAGSWDVVDVVQAPWVEADYKGLINDEIAKGRITFMATARLRKVCPARAAVTPTAVSRPKGSFVFTAMCKALVKSTR